MRTDSVGQYRAARVTLFITILILLIGAVLLTLVARRIGVPYPSLLALGGAAIALMPAMPQIELDPSLALVIFVAPILLDAAFDTSLRDLRDNRVAIVTLVVVAVSLTAVSVAAVFRYFVPDVPWAAAIALGAMVAPPDAAAAIAVLRQLSIPSRVLQILEGESLFNDASALLIFAVAVQLVTDSDATLAGLVPAYALSVVGSGLGGAALGWLYSRTLSNIHDASASIVMQFASTYTVWVLAEHLHLSPILAVVAFGVALATFGAGLNPVLRLKSYAVWDTVVFLSNILAFTLIGVQLGPLLTRLSPDQRIDYFLIGGAVLLTVIVVRIAWVMTFNSMLRFKNWRFGVNLPDRVMRPSARGGLIISWSGMRGIVSLAAALALPEGFPQRELIQFVAFIVVLGTLVIQGFTLGPVVRLLHLPDDGRFHHEVALARRTSLEAALGTLEGDDSVYAQSLRVEYQAVLEMIHPEDEDGPALSALELRRIEAVAAAREAIQLLRAEGQIGDAAYHRIEEVLDRADIYARRHAETA
jgi:Na+/H+ antiporter